MASISNSPSLLLRINPTSLPFSLSILSFPSFRIPLQPRFRALKAASDGGKVRIQDSYGPDLLGKPLISPIYESKESTKKRRSSKLSDDNDESTGEGTSAGEEWDDWEDRILEDTVPLVGFVRMILHSGKYGSGEKLSTEHEKVVLERLLPYHPQFEKKIGCGINYITVGYHPDFESSRCMFIVQKDGKLVDFSYWKCIKGLIRKNYPLYADSFILRHFRQQKRS